MSCVRTTDTIKKGSLIHSFIQLLYTKYYKETVKTENKMGIHDDQGNPEQWRVSHLTPRYGIMKEIYQSDNV